MWKRKANQARKAITNSLRKADTVNIKIFFCIFKLYILHFKIKLNVFKGGQDS